MTVTRKMKNKTIVYPVKFDEADYLDLKQNALDGKVTVAAIIRRLVKKYLAIVRRKP